ncbi:MAG TPA: potassium channel family protein [Acidimicrobiia bacterium]|nr:potassium channel family protein [Acidimicrobiia bacterium]
MTTTSTEQPGPIRFADKRTNPLRVVASRLAGAVAVVLVIAGVVYADRDGYTDSAGGEIGFIDALYYSTVSVTTTGYGDIVPVTDQARLLTVFVVTPMRVAFLVLVVSTTVEVLTASSRYLLRVQRWRRTVNEHYVICGYGTKGRSAASSLVSKDLPRDRIVVVELDPSVADEANRDGFVAVVGDCTRESVLRRAGVERARGVIVAVDRDDTAVLATLTVRLLNGDVQVVAAAKEEENSRILKRGGASVVVTSDEATGRLLGLAAHSPHQAAMIEDLLLVGEGADLVEREASADDLDRPAPSGTVAIVRDGRLLPGTQVVRAGDRLLGIESNGNAPDIA